MWKCAAQCLGFLDVLGNLLIHSQHQFSKVCGTRPGPRTRSTSDHFVDTCAHARRSKVAANEGLMGPVMSRVKVPTGQCLVCPRHNHMNEQEYLCWFCTLRNERHIIYFVVQSMHSNMSHLRIASKSVGTLEILLLNAENKQRSNSNCVTILTTFFKEDVLYNKCE